MYYNDNDSYMAGYYRQITEPLYPSILMAPYLCYSSDYDEDDLDSEDMMRQPPYAVATLLRQFEIQFPQIFTQLEAYRIPRFVLRRVFRGVIGFVLRNVNAAAPFPHPVNQYAETLLGNLMSRQPALFNIFTFFRVPNNLIRSSMLNLIRFILNNISSQGGTGDNAPLVARILRMVETTSGVFSELVRFGITENEARRLTRETIQYVIRNSGPVAPTNIGNRATELVNQLVPTAVYMTMTSKGIAASQARSILRTIVLTALKEIY